MGSCTELQGTSIDQKAIDMDYVSVRDTSVQEDIGACLPAAMINNAIS